MVMHNPRASMPDDAPVVDPSEGHEHGYWGQVPDLEDNETYTARGITKAMQAKARSGDAELKKPARRSRKDAD